MRPEHKSSSESRSKLLKSVIALGVIAAAGGSLYHWVTSANQRPKGEIWFYNLNSRQLFAASDLNVSPMDTKSGAATAVRAYVYTCDAGPKSTNQLIAYLEKFTPEMKKVVEAEIKA